MWNVSWTVKRNEAIKKSSKDQQTYCQSDHSFSSKLLVHLGTINYMRFGAEVELWGVLGRVGWGAQAILPPQELTSLVLLCCS